MSNLLATLRSSTSALDTITQAVGVTQNNISNAGTAGYAKQKVHLHARSFDPETGLAGGVVMGKLQSARDAYVEQSVRAQNGKASGAETRAVSLTKLEQTLQLSAGGSIPTALNRLYQSFSAWAVAPNDLGSKENIVSAGQDVATAFRSTAQKIAGLTTDNANEIRSVVDRINRLAGRIREYNGDIRTGSEGDAGIDAGIHATLDELSADANVHAMQQPDGTYTLLLNGEHPLVIGEEQYELSVAFETPADPAPLHAGAAPPARIFSSSGQEITESAGDGRLGALIDFRHETLGRILGTSTDAGELNRLAKKIVDRMTEAWPPPAQPFFVAGASAVSIAHTISVNPALTPAMLDAVEPGPPPKANGKALALAALANPTAANDKLDGQSFTEFFGRIASRVGSELNDVKFDQQSQTQLLAQVEAFRTQLSGVSLDEEAIQLLQFQRAYEASARMVSTIDEMLEIAVNLGRS